MNAIAVSFEKTFGNRPEVIGFAPGRVNLIGEHTDYNGGCVFPCAIQLGIACAAARRADGKLRFYSESFARDGVVEYSIDDLPPRGVWADYPASVIRAFAAFGHGLEHGADFCFASDLPDGAGLSSSAALEVVTGTVLKELFSIPVTKQEIALIGQFAENRFIGVNCGIMDQFASAMGRADCAILLHAGTLDYAYAPLGDAALVIVNSGVKHSLAASGYNERRRECEAARSALQAASLCALSPEAFERKKHLIDDPVCRRRAKHVIYENQRVLDGAAALKCGDLAAFGALMNASHASLRDDFAVSCAELDFLAETAQRMDGVYGARMTGGGFGGCTVNLVEASAVGNFISAMQTAYRERFGVIPAIYPITAADGARSERNL